MSSIEVLLRRVIASLADGAVAATVALCCSVF